MGTYFKCCINVFVCFRLFSKKGKHLGGDIFPLSVGEEILTMKFFQSSDIFASVHWNGDMVRNTGNIIQGS